MTKTRKRFNGYHGHEYFTLYGTTTNAVDSMTGVMCQLYILSTSDNAHNLWSNCPSVKSMLGK